MPDWTLPPFDADLQAELEAGMAEHRAEIEAMRRVALLGGEPGVGTARVFGLATVERRAVATLEDCR